MRQERQLEMTDSTETLRATSTAAMTRDVCLPTEIVNRICWWSGGGRRTCSERN
jgi:hypothetical protein